MHSHVEFRSSAFPKYELEDEETVNLLCWGKRLAEFVRDTLPAYGIPTEDILCEDWGWLVSIRHEAFPLWIGCGAIDDGDECGEMDEEVAEAPMRVEREVDAPLITEFRLFVVAEPGWLKKLFKKVDTTPAVAKVVAALEKMIADHAEFQDPQWS